MLDEKTKREISTALVDFGTIKFGEFKLTSGKESTYYIDLRTIPSHPDLFQKIVKIYTKKAEEIGLNNFDVVAGIPTSGMIYASILAYNLQKPFIYVRKETKDWGEKRKIEGKMEKGDKVLLVDDLITTGKSIVEAVQTIRKEGGEVNHALVLIDREEGGRERLKKEKVELHCFLRIREALNFLIEEGKLNEAEYNKIIQQIKGKS
ncbi:orotate phosphoribosyltransferase [Candidatus Bathyarchaeota archaeon]|nr:MAG: orotate phosphoribosyltransferase [Candidatus Bathyarchaeota archaeon]